MVDHGAVIGQQTDRLAELETCKADVESIEARLPVVIVVYLDVIDPAGVTEQLKGKLSKGCTSAESRACASHAGAGNIDSVHVGAPCIG